MDDSRSRARRGVPFRLTAAAIGLTLLATPTPRAAQAATPVEVYGRLPSLEDLALSPDGAKLAFVRTNDDSRTLHLVQMADGRALGGARVGDVKLRDVRWMDNDNLLTELSTTSYPPIGFSGSEHEWYQLVIYSISRQKLLPVNFAVNGERTFNTVTGGPGAYRPVCAGPVRDVSNLAGAFFL
jgi:hypothetical protein